MKKKLSEFFNGTWFIRITSLVLALFLFMYVNSSKDGFLRQTTRSGDSSALMSNKTMMVKMPLDLSVNSQKYVVSGYPKYVKVKISGPSALVTTTNNTQNFKVYASLTKLGAGTHTVKLKTSGLNSELRATIYPKTITVKIQPKTTVVKPVSVQLSAKTVNDNYKVGTPKASLSSVQLTGAKSEVARVTKVVAMVTVPKDSTSDIHRQVTLQALDKNGRTVNVVILPSTISVTVPISATKSDDDSSSSSASSDSSNSTSSSSSSTKSSKSSSTTSTSSSTSSSSTDTSSSSESSSND